MRALTMDEVECVGGGAMVELPICSNRTNTRPVSMWDMRWGDVGSYASDALLGWACDDDIQDLEEVKVTAQRVGLEEISVISNTSPAHWAVADFFAGPHQYSAVSPLLLCTPDQAMQALMSPLLSAPGAPQAQEGLDRPVTLWFGYNIVQTVNTSEGKIINRAQPDHIFQGQVTTQVSAAYGGSQITTYGTGVAGENIAMGAINTMIGHLYFGARNIAISMGCDNANEVYVP